MTLRSITRRTALTGGSAVATAAVLASCNGDDDVDTEQEIS